MELDPYKMVNVIFVLLLFSLAGCASLFPSAPTTHHQAPVAPSRIMGCGLASPIAVGKSTTITIAVNPAVSEGRSIRTAIVHVPSRYNSQQRYAVIMSFHGYGGHASGMDASSGFSQLADKQGFLAVYPQALPDGKAVLPIWASVGAIDYGIDESDFVNRLLNTLEEKFCVDAQRIYATGFSNGGGMTNYLACRLASRIAAFAPISGNFYPLPGGCHPGRPVSILDFHGTKDGLLLYTGIPVSKNAAWPLPSIPQWLQEWANRDGCTKGPTVFLRQSNVTGLQWSGCKGGVTVIHYRIEGGGHTGPPPIAGRSSAEVIWNFFRVYHL